MCLILLCTRLDSHDGRFASGPNEIESVSGVLGGCEVKVPEQELPTVTGWSVQFDQQVTASNFSNVTSVEG